MCLIEALKLGILTLVLASYPRVVPGAGAGLPPNQLLRLPLPSIIATVMLLFWVLLVLLMEGLRWAAAAADAAGKRLEIFGVPSSCLELLVASELIFSEPLFTILSLPQSSYGWPPSRFFSDNTDGDRTLFPCPLRRELCDCI